MENPDVLVIGAGPAGLAAGYEAKRLGAREVLILEREPFPGGILYQCIHNGFGLHYFKEDLTGPEYAERFIELAQKVGVNILTNTSVISMSADKTIKAINEKDGLFTLKPGAIILSMGCREKNRGAITLPGERPAGIFTAGLAQKFVNIDGYLPGKRVVILGSGDIGLIMARRLTLEGCEVLAVIEIQPFPGGLTRNIVQCLMDFNIPLLLSHTITFIHGKERVEKVTVSKVDETLKPIPGTEFDIKCDTLLLSVGLIPENELSIEAGIKLDPWTGGPYISNYNETSIDGIFASGNVVQVHDLVDFVSMEGIRAAQGAMRFLKQGKLEEEYFPVIAGRNLKYVTPQRASKPDCLFHSRAIAPLKNARLLVNKKLVKKFKVVRPSEMITVSLPQKFFPPEDGKLIFELEEQE